MVKPYLSIKLKDPQHYYLEDEAIACIIDLRLEKVLKDAHIRISFKGRSSSYSNGTRHHYENIFTTEKEISINKWNTASHLKKTNEIEFSVEVPSGVAIPSYRKLEGSKGGKIEYMIEANLETAGFLKRSIQATHIIQVPLVAKVNINEHGLERTRESNIKWPKHEDNANACVLSAWIPHEGCIRGKDVPIRVEFKEPGRFPPAKIVLVELIAQEFIAPSKDSLTHLTKQLDDKIVQKEEKAIELLPEGGSRLLGTSQIVMFSIPSNITPTIHSEDAKVMKLDYKLRVTIKIPKSDSSDSKDLNVNLPVVIGTTGVSTIYDSGFESIPFGINSNGSDGNNSLHNGHGWPPAPSNNSFCFGGGSLNYGTPLPISPIGFHMPEPNYGIMGYFPQQYSPQRQVYPPNNDNNRFILNTQQLPYAILHDSSDSNKIEGMPMPDFSSNIYPPPQQNNNILTEEIAALSSSPSNSSTIDMMSSMVYFPTQVNGDVKKFGYPPRKHDDTHSNPNAIDHDNHHPEDNSKGGNESISNITSSCHKMHIAPPTAAVSEQQQDTAVTDEDLFSDTEDAINSLLLSIDKPNTPTPPQRHTELSSLDDAVTKSRATTVQKSPNSYQSDVHYDLAMSPTTSRKNAAVTRIDPLDSVGSNNNSTLYSGKEIIY